MATANIGPVLALLEQKPRALDQAAPLEGWQLGEPMQRIRRLMEARSGKEGRRELGAISFDAVKMIARTCLERRMLRLDLKLYSYLPRATVGTTDPRHYRQLMPSAERAAA